MNVTPSELKLNRTIEEQQLELEKILLLQGYNKEILQVADSYDRATKGEGSAIELPRGKRGGR